MRGRLLVRKNWLGGGTTAAVLLAGLAAPANGMTYSVLYSFGGESRGDGAGPEGSLSYAGGRLYGTTQYGGSPGSQCATGCGTVFTVTPAGTEKVLHAFTGIYGGDGAGPVGGLKYFKGKLYGTTTANYGAAPQGTVFSMTINGTETVLHAFGTGGDGSNPTAKLTIVDGTLYGTTEFGGNAGVCGGYHCGTVFSITRGGTETVLHSFGGNGDGGNPLAGLKYVNGMLYGTTRYGGSAGYGSVFSITQSGTETVLYSFKGGSDGADPTGDLSEVNGVLYGTTSEGGNYGSGTVYSITPDGTENVLHSFGSGNDGRDPSAKLTVVNGTLFGTTQFGGLSGCSSSCGTIFSITPSGTEKVLHDFGSGSNDGGWPYANLRDVNGTLYGTTLQGGSYGFGTVFSITP